MTTKSNIQKKAMQQALEKTLGNVTDAASQVGIARKTHYQWMNEDQDYRESISIIGDTALDFVEGKLFELIAGARRTVMTNEGPVTLQDSPNTAAVIFYLKCKGKQRGYIEKIPAESEVPANKPSATTATIDLGNGIVLEF